MTVLLFMGSVALTAAITSLVPVTPGTEQAVDIDYHLVPAAGDVFGA